MVGTASMVGIPLLVAYQLLVSSARKPGSPTGSLAVIVTAAATLAGVLFGSTCWVTSLLFGIRQLLIGSIHTLTALWAKLQQRTYYHPHQERRWKKYCLQEHSQELNNINRQAYYYYYQQQNPPRRSLPDTSLYEILQIQPTATTKEVKRAYYDLAKMVHPDRRNQTRSSHHIDSNNNNININNNSNRDDFLKIHAAYEVLSNPRTRRDYDMLGIKTTKQERLNKTFQFDAGIFFDVLFGVSTELEQYVGELNIKSIAFRLYVWDDERSKKKNNDDDKKKEEEGNDTFWDGLSVLFLEEINHDRELRQVEVALFLQDFVSDYAIHGNLTETAFEDKCQKAARAVIASTPPLFGRQFASSIGTTLYWLGHSYLHSPFGIPMFLAARTRSTYKNMERWTTMMHGLVKFAREVRDVVDGVRRTEANKNIDGESPPPSTKDEITQRIQEKLVQEMAAPLMVLLWEYNQWDIASTLEGAYWKVINDSGGGGGSDG
eukprot:scaffold23464_cov126-Cylindrotheca_fusiformis.AAC.1